MPEVVGSIPAIGGFGFNLGVLLACQRDVH